MISQGTHQPSRTHQAFKAANAVRAAALALCAAPFFSLPSIAADPAPMADRMPQDEVVYFVLPDRFDNADPSNDEGDGGDGPLNHGFDPTHKGFYHGGDLKGLTRRIDYIKSMGATAIWLGPIYKNQPVQGAPGEESAGYHGYWITDFTKPDPHFGTEDDLRAFVEAAHGAGLKVYLDIITNHTADIIGYRECHDSDYQGADKLTDGCPYRSRAEYPYTTRGAADGEAINAGFLGDTAEFQTPKNFARLNRPDFAYTPYIPEGLENVKVPAWLNDVRYYHNRGETTFEGENSLYGDFAGLDDLMTAHPRVVQGFIDIYKDWITRYRIDGFRIDTARHVNPEFWQAFVPAMLDHAEAEGIPNFYIFGEVYDPDPAGLAPFTHVDGFPAVLDFAFQRAVTDVLAGDAPAARLAGLFKADVLYKGGTETAAQLPVFVGNHDMGRFSTFIAKNKPQADDAERLSRVTLAHAMMFFLRGVPVIYYGDEQGFLGDGHDQDARENMFPSQVAIYNDNDLIGTEATTADDNFDTAHPLYQRISGMARLYHAHEALRRGAQTVRHAEVEGGVFAASRAGAQSEYLTVFNTETRPRTAFIDIDPRAAAWQSLHGTCPASPEAAGSLKVELPPLSYVICKSTKWTPLP